MNDKIALFVSSFDHYKTDEELLKSLHLTFIENYMIAFEVEDIIEIISNKNPNIPGVDIIDFITNVFPHYVYDLIINTHNGFDVLDDCEKCFYYCASFIEMVKIRLYRHMLESIKSKTIQNIYHEAISAAITNQIEKCKLMLKNFYKILSYHQFLIDAIHELYRNNGYEIPQV